MSFWPGYRFGRYVIETELGAGAQAVVYRARNTDDDTVVALKVLQFDFSHDPTLRARFERERDVVSSLDHPAVVPVHDAGEVGGQPFLAMGLVEGGTLQSAITEGGGLEPTAALNILRRIAAALDYAHSRGLVHRDVKPANVLLDAQGEAYLSDFGLARLTADVARITRTGVWVGTLEYMAPEQIRAQRVGPEADQYALAAVAYEALTGRPPFVRKGPADLMQAHLRETPRPASALRPELAGADAVLARALAKESGARFGSATAFVHALGGGLRLL